MLDDIKRKINDSYYWDARVRALDCNYFGDEVKLEFEDGEKYITYYFEECYKVMIQHVVEYPKDRATRELKVSQIPYFMQNVELEVINNQEKILMEFKINMYPIELSIICNKFSIY